MARPQKIAIVGAGPVGSLAALYAAQRGHEVELYELRPDLRDPGIIPLNFTKSINLALSERGINAMRHANHPTLLEYVMEATIPMRGRMIHGKGADGELYEHPQDYDARGKIKTIFAVDRAGLNTRLLDILDDMPNVSLFFNHKLTGADFAARKAWFEVRDRDRDRRPASSSGKGGGGGSGGGPRPREIEVDFDLMIGADGAHSAVRYHMMKFVRMDYQQEYIDTLWCEFHIGPQPVAPKADAWARFRISPHHLHIWPGKDSMFIAIPSEDGSFTCTLFMPSGQFARLEADPSGLPSFFDAYFPGVTALISEDDLVDSFASNPHLPLINLKCRPYHHSSAGVIIGDAAHAMVPFYGQGMNAGMEDVRILFSILDKHVTLDEAQSNNNNPYVDEDDAYDEDFVDDHALSVTWHPSALAVARGAALAEYSAVRAADAHTINDLALENYVEMRASVLSRRYRLRKYLEEFMSLHFPGLGWQTKYSRVSFGNEGYAEVVRRSEHQGRVLMRSFYTLLSSPLVLGAALLGYRYRGYAVTALRLVQGLRPVLGS